ncbi:MAG: flagellar hook-length control protein FliK [Lentilitoribacter sp.]
MNSISPALANVSAPVKSGRGMDKNSKLDNQDDVKFQLPEKKSKGNSESVANQNDNNDGVNASEKVSAANEKPAEDTKATNNAENALLELINSYQPRNAGKSETSPDDNNSQDELFVEGTDDLNSEETDAMSTVATALVQAQSNDKLDKTTNMKDGEQASKSADAKLDDKTHRLDKSHLENAQSGVSKSSDETAKPAVAAAASALNASQDKDATLRKDGQSNTPDVVDGKKSSAVLNAEKAMSDGAKDQGSKQNDDRGPGANISMVDKSGTKMAGVEVLEAKTFIAPTNASTNANNISQAILKSQQISSAAAAQSSEPLNQTAQPKALNTLKIQLNPAELGVVTATMKLNGDNLQVQLRVENIDAYRMLSEDSSSIVKALKGQGFGIDQINLTLASSDRGSNQQGNPQNGQSFQSHTDQEQMSNQSGNDRNKDSETSNGSDTMAPGNELAQQESVQKDNYSSGVYL